MQVIIVGHGPSLLQGCKGEAIDLFDAVVRLKWGQSGRKDAPKYFGTRMDYLCSTMRTNYNYTGLEMKEFWGFENERCGRNIYSIAKKWEPVPVIIEYEAMNYWIDIYKKLRTKGVPHFSTGLAAIIMACVRLKPKVLALVGFDNVVSGRMDNFDTVFRPYGGDFPDHQWDVEHDMVPLITKHYGAKLAVLQ